MVSVVTAYAFVMDYFATKKDLRIERCVVNNQRQLLESAVGWVDADRAYERLNRLLNLEKQGTEKWKETEKVAVEAKGEADRTKAEYNSAKKNTRETCEEKEGGKGGK